MRKYLVAVAILDACLFMAWAFLEISVKEGAHLPAGGRVTNGGLQTGSFQSGSLQTSSFQSGSLQTSGLQTGSIQNGYAGEGRKIALTFDDGPHPTYTGQLLDGLKERGVKATFFVTGEHAKLHPDLIKRMWEEGHLIGNHTYSHVQLRSDNRDAFGEELRKTNEVISGITGEEVLYVRPPYGSWDRTLEKELNMFPVLWTIDPTDWSCMDAETVTRRVVKKAKENAIILLHDYYKTSVDAALMIIDELMAEGFEFVTVDEVLME